MQINPLIFKAYDIRGIYPEQFNEEIAYKLGRAFVLYSKAKKAVIGRDMRLASPAISEAIIKGLTDQGADVDDIGLASSDTFYYALNKYQYQGGIMVTASHNPKEWVGCKIFGPGNEQVSGLRGMEDLKKIIFAGNFPAEPKGGINKKEVLPECVNFALKLIDINKIKPFKVVLDAGSGMASSYLTEALKYLPIEPVKLYFDLDGNFPHHEPNPLKPENTKLAQEAVLKEGADFGFSFDGDADRILLIDEKGQRVDNDITLAFAAKWFLQKYPRVAIVKQIVCSWAVDDAVHSLGGRVAVSRVGTAFIKQAMEESRAVFGGEISGHFYFRDFWNFDSGLISFLIILQIISESGKRPSEIVSEVDPYFRSGEINYEIENPQAVTEEIKKRYADGKIDLKDGVTVSYPNWWFNVRLSNTEPLLRLNIETKTKELLEEKKGELMKIISP